MPPKRRPQVEAVAPVDPWANYPLIWINHRWWDFGTHVPTEQEKKYYDELYAREFRDFTKFPRVQGLPLPDELPEDEKWQVQQAPTTALINVQRESPVMSQYAPRHFNENTIEADISAYQPNYADTAHEFILPQDAQADMNGTNAGINIWTQNAGATNDFILPQDGQVNMNSANTGINTWAQNAGTANEFDFTQIAQDDMNGANADINIWAQNAGTADGFNFAQNTQAATIDTIFSSQPSCSEPDNSE